MYNFFIFIFSELFKKKKKPKNQKKRSPVFPGYRWLSQMVKDFVPNYIKYHMGRVLYIQYFSYNNILLTTSSFFLKKNFFVTLLSSKLYQRLFYFYFYFFRHLSVARKAKKKKFPRLLWLVRELFYSYWFFFNRLLGSISGRYGLLKGGPGNWKS